MFLRSARRAGRADAERRKSYETEKIVCRRARGGRGARAPHRVRRFGGGNDNGGGTTEQSYTITAPSSDDYQISAPVSAKEGERVNVTVTMRDADSYLEGVTYNGTACSGEDGSYTFTMPAENVTLAVQLGTYKEVLTDGMATFASSNLTTIAKDSGTATLLITFRASWLTSLKRDIVFSDESVIPASAVEYDEVKNSDLVGSSGTNSIEQLKINIDTSKVSLGSTWITMSFSGNSSSQRGTLVVKITVAESVTVETWQETLVFDVSALRGADEDTVYHLHLMIADTMQEGYQSFDDLKAVDGKVTVEIEYVARQEYLLSFGVMDQDGDITYHDLSGSVGSGSSVTGFNQYVNRRLSFIADAQELEIDVLNTTHT